jgi:acetoin utilization deacetylase AcuC-like enzyme
VDAVCAESARRAAAGGGAAPSGFALCRPPGHHALPKSAMGFCIFSNAALAARHAQAVHGLRRVLIYDFDVHHGNGTADTFAADPDVLYISTHQAGSYPGTGAVLETGTGAGEGATLNVPLPGGAGDAAARAALEDVIGPAAERFKPDIILVSAGYDAHWCAATVTHARMHALVLLICTHSLCVCVRFCRRDPLAGLQFTDATYHALSSGLRDLAARLCGGRIVFLLEGGYDLTGLAGGAADSFRALLGVSPAAADAADARALLAEPADKVQALLREVRAVHGL